MRKKKYNFENKDGFYHFLYIIKNGETNEYKIGISGNLNKRFSNIQTGCPHEIKVIKIWSHYQKEVIKKYERVLHRYYEKLNCKIRNNGEWFILSEEEISKLCQPNNIEEQNNLIKEILKSM